MRLLVTGCPRSGNTLMSLLIAWGFKGWQRAKGETLPKKGTNIVGKRLVVAPALADILEYDPALNVVWMIRDPRDACLSIHPAAPKRGRLVTPALWKERARVAAQVGKSTHPHHRRIVAVQYEDLVRYPDQTQAHIAHYFTLTPGPCWSAWAGEGISPATERKNALALSGIRPVETSRIGAHKTVEGGVKFAAKLAADPALAALAEELGYGFYPQNGGGFRWTP